MSEEKKPVEKPEEEPKPAETSAQATESFTGRLQKAFDEALDLKLKAMEKRFDEMIDTKLKALEIEAEQVLRKGLGVSKDTPLTTADMPKLIQAVRKAALEKTENERTPVGTEKAGPEGNKPEDPIDNAFKPYLEEEAKK